MISSPPDTQVIKPCLKPSSWWPTRVGENPAIPGETYNKIYIDNQLNVVLAHQPQPFSSYFNLESNGKN